MKSATFHADMSAMRLIRTLIILLCCAAAAAGLIFLTRIPILMWSSASLFTLIAIFAGMIYTPLYFRSISTEISENTIRVSSGVFLKNSGVMKLEAVQYATLISTPFSEKSGLNFILLNALGGKQLIPFMKHTEALSLYAELTAALESYPNPK